MALGGARPGAGRPRKSDKYAGHIVAAENAIADRLPQYIDNLSRLADGIYREEEDEQGVKYVYSTPPDRAANEYLINRIMGRPIDRKEFGVDKDNPLKVLVQMVGDRA